MSVVDDIYKGLVLIANPIGTGCIRIFNALKALADRIGPCNYAGNRAPIATDDVNAGYSVGSRWIDQVALKSYICIRATANNALWLVDGIVPTAPPPTTKIVTTSTWTADVEELIICTVSATITLPNPTSIEGRPYTIMVGASDISVSLTPEPENLSSPYLDNNGYSVTVRVINAKWRVVAEVIR